MYVIGHRWRYEISSYAFRKPPVHIAFPFDCLLYTAHRYRKWPKSATFYIIFLDVTPQSFGLQCQNFRIIYCSVHSHDRKIFHPSVNFVLYVKLHGVASHSTVTFILILLDHHWRKFTVRRPVREGHRAIISSRRWSISETSATQPATISVNVWNKSNINIEQQ